MQLQRNAFLRQLDIVPPEKLAVPVKLIGIGGIGSAVLLALVKMGCSDIEVWDGDTVEEHNLPNQMFCTADLGKPKVEAGERVALQFGGKEVKFRKHQEKLDRNHMLSGIAISGVDSIEARREIWENNIRMNVAVQLYIDARMGGEVGLVYPVYPFDPDDIRFYESMLHPPETVAEEPCTARAIIYNTLGLAACIAAIVKMQLTGLSQKVPRELAIDFRNLQVHQVTR